MYSPGAPPLPLGQPPGQAQQVVPPDLRAHSLWQNGIQLRQHLRELLQRASLLKAVAAELQAFEILKSKGSTLSTTLKTSMTITESAPHSRSPLDLDEKQESTDGVEVPTNASEDVSGQNNLSVTLSKRFPDRTTVSDDHVKAQNDEASRAAVRADPLVPDYTTPNAALITEIHRSGRTETEVMEAASKLQDEVKKLLAPLQGALGGRGGWEHAAAAARLKSNREKIQRNRRWRKRKRQQIAEAHRKEEDGFEEADRKADEWRAREIAKSIARSKMEKMKEVAEKKAKEERARLEAELEMVLMVEKLQELRALRIQKLKKQGRFFPDEDDKFMERVRAAVEEEERQAAVAADTRAAAAAIASAAEAAKASCNTVLKAAGDSEPEDQLKTDETATDVLVKDSTEIKVDVVEVANTSNIAEGAHEETRAGAQEAHGALPAEFYHFYHGSQVDMGALIEVRRAWDAFLMPGGSRIPGHWIEAPPPADAVWASYLVQPTSKRQRTVDGQTRTKVKKGKKKRAT